MLNPKNWRKAFWHFRKGGIPAVQKFYRNQKLYAKLDSKAPALQNPACQLLELPPLPNNSANQNSPSAHENSTPEFPVRHPVTAGIIADEFTLQALAPEWRQVLLKPKTWAEQLESCAIDLLFVESCWHGNKDAWRYQVIGGDNTPCPALVDLVKACQAQGIPTVFWNKEDPVHYTEAINTARLFDWVFTTDADMIPRYQQDLGHSRVQLLPFAAQINIHNPLKLIKTNRQPYPLRDIAFAGMYFAHKYPERRSQMDALIGAAVDVSGRLNTGLEIFSRYLGDDPKYQFPAPFNKHVIGSLNYSEMLAAYRAYKVFLNVNSVVGSSTMCARRIFELTACGAAVLSAPSPAIPTFFPAGEISTAADRTTAGYLLRSLVADDLSRERQVHLGQRRIWQAHTYAHRINQVLDAVGIVGKNWSLPSCSPLITTNRPHKLPHVLRYLSQQKDVKIDPLICTHGFSASAEVKAQALALGLRVKWMEAPSSQPLGACYNQLIVQAEGDFIAKMDDDDLYSPYYLFEQLMATQYSQAELVGKHAHYMYLEAQDRTVLRFGQWEHRYTSFVSGPTIVLRADLAKALKFAPLSRGEDSTLLKDVLKAGGRICASSRFGFVQLRSRGAHTWGISEEELLANSVTSHYGLPNETELPGLDGLEFLQTDFSLR